MLDHNHGDIIFHCDGKDCHGYLAAETSNFAAARNVLTLNRWKPVKHGAEWLHLCPDCQNSGGSSHG